MLVYEYDKKTREYIGTNIAYIDPVATKKAGKRIYALPVYTTLEAPPKVGTSEAAVFENGTWIVKKDLRGQTVYNVNTRKSVIWDKLGELPNEYVTNLPERLEDVKTFYLQSMKVNFNKCMLNTKVKVPSTDLFFSYDSLDRLKREQNVGIQVSRDDNNKIYSLTTEEYNHIINYMVIYGQYMYLQKWTLEGLIKNCFDLEMLKTYRNKLDFEVDTNFINRLVQMSEEERKTYFKQMANNIM